MSVCGQGTKWQRNMPENFNRLSKAHERYRETDDRPTGDSIQQTWTWLHVYVCLKLSQLANHLAS